MTNTDRMAQARAAASKIWDDLCDRSGFGLEGIDDEMVAEIQEAHAEIIASSAAALASLAPTAESEGDSVCQDDDGCPIENAVLRREWRKLTAQVAALTAQCASDKALLDSQRISIESRDEFGEPCRTLHVGIDLRAAIAAGNGEGV
jgi:hypothetical protein